MQLTFREGTLGDFGEFWRTFFFEERNNQPLLDQVKREWQVFMGTPTTLCVIIEDSCRPRGERMVGIAQLAFVSKDFTEFLRQEAEGTLSPWVLVHATQTRSDGSSSYLLDMDALADANSDKNKGVNALITRWATANRVLTPEEGPRVREYLNRAFAFFWRGYQYKEVLLEVVGEELCGWARNSGFDLLSDYERYYACHPPTPPPHKRPFLLSLTREEAARREGALMCQVFVYQPPRFFFSRKEQEVLIRAVRGEDDLQIAAALGITEAAVKKRWLSIFDRTAATDPDLLPGSSLKTRGAEKRRTLLRYLQDHLEELRPLKAKK